MERLLTTQEAAVLAGVGPTAIKRWADQGLLVCLRTAGGHRRFRESEVMSFLNRQRAQDTRANGGAGGGIDDWVDALLMGESGYGAQARLLAAREREGAWYRVAAVVGEVITEVGRRWSEGALTIMEEHLASERLARALARVGESFPIPPDAARALLVCAEGDDHTLGLSCVELCLREAGWRTRWAGRATPPEEIVRWLEEDGVELLAASASEKSKSKALLSKWVELVAPACKAQNAELILGGRGAWPDPPSYGWRLQTFEELHGLLIGLAATRARRERL